MIADPVGQVIVDLEMFGLDKAGVEDPIEKLPLARLDRQHGRKCRTRLGDEPCGSTRPQ